MDQIIDYVTADFALHPYLYGLQFFFSIWALYLYSQKSYNTDEEPLTPVEIEEMIDSWVPAPLVPVTSCEDDLRNAKMKLLDGPTGCHVVANGKECVNFASVGFLNMHINPEVIEAAIDCTNIYGVGSCGPRGFYGSLQPHMDLEERIARFMGADESLIFSSSFQTIASVIPAFSTTGDVLIVDRGICLSVQNGVSLSRSQVFWFEHNDVDDFQRILHSLQEIFQKKQKRVWLIVEGLYANFGDITPLDEIMNLKEQYPFRIILDDTYGIGVLGENGLGVVEHFGVDINDIEIVVGGLGTSFGGVGGFACGNHSIVDHMRLNCTGYVFSASLPPYISAGCIKAIDMISSDPTQRKQLAENIQYFNQETAKKSWSIKTKSSPLSPIIHYRLKKNTTHEYDQQEFSTIVDSIFDESNILLSHSSYLKQEKHIPPPSLKIILNADHTREDIELIISSLDSFF